ncbi:hypothetical protein SLEP1_g26742 [Rubroshorea leprosula]|uniref:Uncharacterized protein n=1 Tax=Rubroshorea leprosula TaxID=152421 RepID=A0AAV5JYT1_9ROSI|nr:hypothetical protein SLEP1_g26742 [Rubroshorea leprosula]
MDPPLPTMVTALVATNRDHKWPAINCPALEDLETAFSCLKSASGTDIAVVKLFFFFLSVLHHLTNIVLTTSSSSCLNFLFRLSSFSSSSSSSSS